MSAPSPRVPLERVRVAAQRAVDETSLRKVARAVGLSPMGLAHFLAGETEPYRPTVKKLVHWFVRDAAVRRGVDEATAHAALFILVDGLPEADAEAVREEVRLIVRTRYRKNKIPVPEWLAEG